jgi:hypothetical protein
MKVLTCSRNFPKGHPKAGQPTYFVEKIWNGFRDESRWLPDSFQQWIENYGQVLKGDEYLTALAIREIKLTTIRAGSRWKAGDMASLRIWSGAPYRSKQVEFAQVKVKRTWAVEINVSQTSPVILIENRLLTYEAGKELAANDGLLLTDFISWFNIYPKKKAAGFTGQIICWSDKIDYTFSTTGKPDLQTTYKHRMKRTIKIEKEVLIKTLKVKAEVRYWADATVNGKDDTEGRIPCRNEDNWCPVIDIDTGIIRNWKKGVTADIHYKVCDAGVYELIDADGEIIVQREGYVPEIMSPEENGYGDYIIMKVNADGQICNWQIELDDFFEED